MIMRRGVGPESEMMFFGGATEKVEHASRLHAGALRSRIELDDVAHVFREVEDHGHVAALAAKAGAAAATEHGSSELAGDLHRLDDVVLVARDDDADRRLPIVGCIRGIKGSAAVVKADFAFYVPVERRFQAAGVDLGSVVVLCRN